MTAWFNATGFSSALTVATKPLNGPPWFYPYLSWLIRIGSATMIEIDVGNGSTYSAWPITVPALQAGQWYHVALTYNGTSLTAYLNGAYIGTHGGVTGNLGYGARPILVGADYGASPAFDYFMGKIDDVRVYNRALSSAEISAFVLPSPTQLYDTDADGLPDYFEDRNGDGLFDSGETDWNVYNSANGLAGAVGLLVFTPLE